MARILNDPKWLTRALIGVVCILSGLLAGQLLARGSSASVKNQPALAPVTGARVSAAQDDPAPQSGASGYYKTYAGSDFYAADPGRTKVEYAAGGQVAVVSGTTSDDHFLALRLDLPQGARITEVVFFYTREKDSEVAFGLTHTDPAAGETATDLALGVSSDVPVAHGVQAIGASAAFETPIAVIDNAAYAYALQFFPSPGSRKHTDGLRLAGARVGYDLPTVFLPQVSR